MMVIAFLKRQPNKHVSLAQLVSRYFLAPLKKALGTTGLTLALSHRHNELLKAMSYFYDGYSFSEKPEEQTRVFSPVSVSLFLRDPEEGFWNYWSNTGSQSPFTLKLFKKCNQYIARSFLRDLYQYSSYWSNTGSQSPFTLKLFKKCNQYIARSFLRDLYQYSSHPRIEIDASLEDVVASLFPVFSLAVDLPEQLHSKVSLIKTSLHSQTVQKVQSIYCTQFFKRSLPLLESSTY